MLPTKRTRHPHPLEISGALQVKKRQQDGRQVLEEVKCFKRHPQEQNDLILSYYVITMTCRSSLKDHLEEFERRQLCITSGVSR